MKFALIALVAAVSAIRVSDGPSQCVPIKDSNPVFDEIDTNNNGKVSKLELKAAVTKFLAKNGLHPSDEQVEEF